MDYRKRLFDLRIDNDLRQEDVAKILKISSQAYGMYENGKRSLPIEHLVTLSMYYNVTSDYILGLSDIKNKF
ncbi:MAG: helix-turn-helix domain-containing protein [Acutalibacteraceae bacterium]